MHDLYSLQALAVQHCGNVVIHVKPGTSTKCCTSLIAAIGMGHHVLVTEQLHGVRVAGIANTFAVTAVESGSERRTPLW